MIHKAYPWYKTLRWLEKELPLFHKVVHYDRVMEKGNGTPLQNSCLENPMDRGAWWAAVHGVAKSWTQLSDFTFTFHFHALKKEMATPSSTLAWRIPGTREPGGLPSMGSHRVGHDWSDLAAAAAAISQIMWIYPQVIFLFYTQCYFYCHKNGLTDHLLTGPL